MRCHESILPEPDDLYATEKADSMSRDPGRRDRQRDPSSRRVVLADAARDSKVFQKRNTKDLREALEWAEAAVLRARRSGIEIPAVHFQFIREVKAEIQKRKASNDPGAPRSKRHGRRFKRDTSGAITVEAQTYELSPGGKTDIVKGKIRYVAPKRTESEKVWVVKQGGYVIAGASSKADAEKIAKELSEAYAEGKGKWARRDLHVLPRKPTALSRLGLRSEGSHLFWVAATSSRPSSGKRYLYGVEGPFMSERQARESAAIAGDLGFSPTVLRTHRSDQIDREEIRRRLKERLRG